jgi:hypothetical protein
MFGWFRKQSPTAPDGLDIVTLRPELPFAWPAGATLTALEESFLAVNILALLGPDEPISALLRGPDAMEVDAAFGGEWLLLRLLPGMTVTAVRACEVSLSEAEGTTRRFRLTGAAPVTAPDPAT